MWGWGTQPFGQCQFSPIPVLYPCQVPALPAYWNYNYNLFGFNGIALWASNLNPTYVIEQPNRCDPEYSNLNTFLGPDAGDQVTENKRKRRRRSKSKPGRVTHSRDSETLQNEESAYFETSDNKKKRRKQNLDFQLRKKESKDAWKEVRRWVIDCTQTVEDETNHQKSRRKDQAGREFGNFHN